MSEKNTKKEKKAWKEQMIVNENLTKSISELGNIVELISRKINASAQETKK